MRRYVAVVLIAAAATGPAAALDIGGGGKVGGLGIGAGVSAGSQGISAGVGASAGSLGANVGASVGAGGANVGASVSTGNSSIGGGVAAGSTVDSSSAGAATGTGTATSDTTGSPNGTAVFSAQSGGSPVSLPPTLKPTSTGSDKQRVTAGYPFEPMVSLKAKPGTPLKVVSACRAAIMSAATPLGATSVSTVSAGPMRQRKAGLEAPIEVRINYVRRGAVQLRQAKVLCRLDAKGKVSAVT